MVSVKNDDKKGKTKLKKRKLEKHKRKQLEKKFLYKNKRAILSAAFVAMIIIASFIGFSMYQSSEANKSTVELGDKVKFNFICYYDNGEIIQHTIASNLDDVTIDTDLSGNQLKNSQTLIIGGYEEVEGILIPLFWNDDLFLDQKKGETFYISIGAEDVYGPENSPITEEERVFNVPRQAEKDRYGTMDTETFTEDYGEPEVGMELEIDDEAVAVTSITEDEITYEYLYEVGDEIIYEYGSGNVTEVTDDKIVLYYDGEEESAFYANDGGYWLPVHIKDVTDDELILEVEHYNFKILIDNIDKDVIDQDNWSISDGDFAIVRYIGYYEDGEVFSSSITDDIELNKDLPLDDTYNNTPLYITVQPGTVIDGTNTVIDGFNDALKGMVAGEEKTVKVLPEDGYGLRDESLVVSIDFLVGVYDIVETVPKVINMSLEDYIEEYGSEPFLDDEVTFAYGTGTITDTSDGVTIELTSLEEGEFYHNNVLASIIAEDDDTITIEHYPEEGEQVYIEDGDTATVHLEDGKYRVEYDPESLEIDGTFANGTIVEIDDDHLVIDRNHEMAGKTLYFKIKVMDFRKVSD